MKLSWASLGNFSWRVNCKICVLFCTQKIFVLLYLTLFNTRYNGNSFYFCKNILNTRWVLPSSFFCFFNNMKILILWYVNVIFSEKKLILSNFLLENYPLKFFLEEQLYYIYIFCSMKQFINGQLVRLESKLKLRYWAYGLQETF